MKCQSPNVLIRPISQLTLAEARGKKVRQRLHFSTHLFTKKDNSSRLILGDLGLSMTPTKRTYLMAGFLIAISIMMFSLLLAVNDSATVTAQTRFTQGTWKGKMVGKGSAMKAYYIYVTSNLSGFFDGDSSKGRWTGTYVSIYQGFTDSETEKGAGSIQGDYTWNIDSAGALTGIAILRVTGLFTGDWKIQIQGSASSSGVLKGTWSGTYLPQVLFFRESTPATTDIIAEASGDLEGTIQSTSTLTISPSPTTQPPPTTPSPPPLTTPTQSPTQTPTRPPAQHLNYQFILYAVFAVIIIAAIYAVRIKSLR